MSGYEKTQQAGSLKYETPASLHEPALFGPYAQPPYAQHLFQPCSVDNAYQEDDLHYIANPELPIHHQMDESSPVVVDQRFRRFPQIISSLQPEGAQGSIIRLHLQSPHELRGPPKITFFFLFASRRVDCALQLISDPNSSPRQYVLSAEVPAFTSTAWHAFTVPLRLMMEGSYGGVPCLGVDAGVFTYTDYIDPHDQPRKRRLSSDSTDPAQRLIKKQSAQPLQGPPPPPPPEAAMCSPSPFSFISTPIANPSSRVGTEGATPPQPPSHKYSASVASVTSARAPSPRTPSSWSPAFTPLNQVSSSSKADAIPSQAPAADLPASQTPALIRTSTMQQPSPCLGPAPAAQPFNPYAMYPSKAVLKLMGDLSSMTEGWSLEEWDAKRRLVQFTRQQKGSTIHADFKTVAPEDRQANTICISCIWWEEKKECYVTSVDTIFLLESLVAVRFTVEEKNRIRRNLEGFRPLTVSKSKADSEEFFKIIMGFPNPKPRNIEKDVKVFPWKILAHALKKIIGKYSASYSSTASALSPPTVSHFAGHGPSEPRVDLRASNSPQLDELNHGTSPYPISAPSISPQMAPQSVIVPISRGPPSELCVQVPTAATGYPCAVTQSFSTSSQYCQHPTCSSQPMTTPAAAGRVVGSWNGDQGAGFGHEIQDHTTANVHAYQYNRLLNSLGSSESYVPAASYTTPQSGM